MHEGRQGDLCALPVRPHTNASILARPHTRRSRLGPVQTRCRGRVRPYRSTSCRKECSRSGSLNALVRVRHGPRIERSPVTCVPYRFRRRRDCQSAGRGIARVSRRDKWRTRGSARVDGPPSWIWSPQAQRSPPAARCRPDGGSALRVLRRSRSRERAAVRPREPRSETNA